jgi:hypothetical protein
LGILNKINKRGQLSIFIILGVLMLILVTTYFISLYKESDLDVSELRAMRLDEITDPVERYITECLIQTSKNAILQMGELGGYTNLERNGFNIKIDDPTNSDAVVLSIGASPALSNEIFAIPYYYQMKSPSGCLDNCEFVLGFPELYNDAPRTSIEGELDIFIDENIDRCINDFEIFKRQGLEIIEHGEPKVDSRVNVNTISFRLNYPIEIKTTDTEYGLNNFYTSHNINLNEIYNLALEITALQARYRFLEMQVLNLISSYSNLDSDIPPVAETTFEFGSPGKFWVRSQIKETIQGMLSKYVKALRAVGSNNYVDIGANNELSRKLLDAQMSIELSKDYDLDVYFNYLDFWPIYFDITCDDEICKADTFSSSFLLLFGIQRYRFYYSVSHPVMVKIHDKKALNGEGFNYFFFLESNIRHHEPVIPSMEVEIESGMASSELLCNENQRNSGNYTFNVVDALTDEPVKDIVLSYICGEQSCLINKLESETFDGKLPICLGGVLSIGKPGYMSYGIPMHTQLNEGEDLGEIKLEPFRRKNITISKLNLVKPIDGTEEDKWEFRGESNLKKGQEAIVIMEKILLPGESSHIQIIELTGDERLAEVDVVPGDYNLKVILLDKNTIIVPPEKREEKELWGLIKETYYVPEDPIIFNETSPWPLGGIDDIYTLSNQIDSKDQIVIKSLAFEIGEVPEIERKAEDLIILSLLENYTTEYNNQLGFSYR